MKSWVTQEAAFGLGTSEQTWIIEIMALLIYVLSALVWTVSRCCTTASAVEWESPLVMEWGGLVLGLQPAASAAWTGSFVVHSEGYCCLKDYVHLFSNRWRCLIVHWTPSVGFFIAFFILYGIWVEPLTVLKTDCNINRCAWKVCLPFSFLVFLQLFVGKVLDTELQTTV